MGVYLKGMNKDTFDLIVGSVFTFPKGVVEVKEPHGRLIDAEIVSSAIADVYDIFIKNNGKVTQKSMDYLIASTVDSKTIIEAEEGK